MRRSVTAARGWAVVVAGCLAAAGCGRDGGELRDATRAREASQAADTGAARADSAPPPMVVDTGYEVPAFTGDTAPPAPPAPAGPAPTDTLPPDTLPARPPAPGEGAIPAGWTAGIREVRRAPSPPSIVTGVRAARNAGFDRIVLAVEGARVPGYRVEYVDRPVRQCGSGEATEVAGQGWLMIRLNGAAAHDDRGRATVRDRERSLDLPVMREWEVTCDFEGEFTVVVGVARPNRYRVIELANPTRLAVDVQQ